MREAAVLNWCTNYHALLRQLLALMLQPELNSKRRVMLASTLLLSTSRDSLPQCPTCEVNRTRIRVAQRVLPRSLHGHKAEDLNWKREDFRHR